MAAADVVYRKAQSRLHRVLGTYLALTAWKQGCDCVIVKRESLLSFLDLEKMKNTRIDWLKEDLEYLFPYCKTTKVDGVYASIFLSRIEFPKSIFAVTETLQDRVKKMHSEGINAVILELPKEKELIQKMAILLSGIDE